MAIAFLSTLAVQIGSACFNSIRSQKHANEISRKQQAYEEKVALNGIDNARKEFAELCALQRHIEVEMQKDRLELIRTNHENSILQAAYEASLSSWPLMVPPYVIKNDTLHSIELNTIKAIPLNCILTTSTDNKFNKAVFYEIEEALACFCSKYWNVSANKSIRFFQEAWRDNFKDIGIKHKDLYAHLSDVPTLVISPIIKNGKLIFRFYWWGLSGNPADAHLNDVANELDPEVNIMISSNHEFSYNEINIILSTCIPKLEAFISYFADVYYWNFYNSAPQLPILVSSGVLSLSKKIWKELSDGYTTTLKHPNSTTSLIPERLSYITAIFPLLNPDEFNSLICEQADKIKKCPLLGINDLNAINGVADKINSTDIKHSLNKHLKGVYVYVEVIEDLDNLNIGTLTSIAKKYSEDAFRPVEFVFIRWSKNTVIGTYCTADGSQCIYSESNSVRFFVIYSKDYKPTEPSSNKYDLNIIQLDMNKFSNRTSSRERVGRWLINIGEKLKNANGQHVSSQRISQDPWGDTSDVATSEVNQLEAIVNYFIAGVDNSSIEYKRCGTSMSIQLVLDWLDGLSDTLIDDANQVYVLRGIHQERGRILYCAFLAKDDVFTLRSCPKICFVCDNDTSEMRELFSGKSIYVIPFED